MYDNNNKKKKHECLYKLKKFRSGSDAKKFFPLNACHPTGCQVETTNEVQTEKKREGNFPFSFQTRDRKLKAPGNQIRTFSLLK